MDLKAQFAAIEPEIRAAIDRVLERQSFVNGAEVRAFEQEFAAYSGVAEAVAVSNGTTALELTLWALGIGPGDEVVTPAWTFWATPEAILRQGATPVFADVREDDWTLDPEAVAQAVTPRTKAVIPVHIFGHPANVAAIAAAAPGAAIIEDAAQAHGATYHGRPVGTDCVASTYSFYPGKNLGAYGDAGAILTNDAELAARLRALADHGRSEKYTHPFAGTNARCDELQAAVLRAKLPHLPDWTRARQSLAARYEERLAGSFRVQQTQPWATHVRHLFVIAHPERDELLARLKEHGVGAGVHYPIPCHEQPAWTAAKPQLPVTEELARTVLSLPLYPELTDAQHKRVCESLAMVTA